ncbi:MAG TPA: hypothetical protein V6D29_20145 [Leptolyngbyaceae cyanobacterium]
MQDNNFSHDHSSVNSPNQPSALVEVRTDLALPQWFVEDSLVLMPILCATPALVLLLLASGTRLYRKYVFNQQLVYLRQVIALERLLALRMNHPQ